MYNLKTFFVKIEIIILILFSFLINHYYGSIGVLPQDTFAYYDTGYRILNGAVPFKDYWTVSGLFLDYLQAGFFYLFGISWTTYVLNGSVINTLITLLFYFFLKNFDLKRPFLLFYSLCFAVLANPSMGVPFTDHYSTFLSLAGIFLFFIAIKNQKRIYWFLIPIFFFLGFLSKQSPAGYLLITIIILTATYIFLFKKIDFLKYFLLSSIICLLSLYFFLLLNKIDMNTFLTQYIFYPQTIAEERFRNFNPDFKNIFLNFKFIYLLLFILILTTVLRIRSKNDNQNFKNIILNNQAIILITISLIFHQIMTKNFIYIFFLIPLIGSFIQLNIQNRKKTKELLSLFVILLTIFTTSKYHLRFNEDRKMLNLENINLQNSVEAELLHQSLKGLNWITTENEDNPIVELNLIKDSLDKIKKDDSKIMMMSGYLFFSAIVNKDLNNPSRWPSMGDASNPAPENKYHLEYKTFIENLVFNKNVETIYSTPDNSDDIFSLIFDKNCRITEEVNDFLTKHDIRSCLKKLK